MAITDDKVLTGAILDVLLENYYAEKAVEDAADSAMASDISDLSDELTTYKTSNDSALNTKTPLPVVNQSVSSGTNGQVLTSNGDGTTSWQAMTSVSVSPSITSQNGTKIGSVTVNGTPTDLYAPSAMHPLTLDGATFDGSANTAMYSNIYVYEYIIYSDWRNFELDSTTGKYVKEIDEDFYGNDLSVDSRSLIEASPAFDYDDGGELSAWYSNAAMAQNFESIQSISSEDGGIIKLTTNTQPSQGWRMLMHVKITNNKIEIPQ